MADMSLRRFASAMARIADGWDDRQQRAMEQSGRRLARAAQGYIGVYQPALSPFPAWQPLADYTVADRVAKGFRPDDPLLRTGELRASIGYTVTPTAVIVGSPDIVAFWQEFGTVKIPARSFIGRAVAEHGKDEAKAIAEFVFRPLARMR